MNNDYERYLSVIEDNVNVGKTNDGKEFLILVSSLATVCFVIYFFAGAISNFFIDRMSLQTQLKIEQAFSPMYSCNCKKLENLEPIKTQIVSLDKNLQGKSTFPLYEAPDKEINAFVTPDGKIYFTRGLLDEVKDEEILTFVLAHELGHYAHRDHLKSMSRDIVAALILSVLSGGQKEISSTLNTMTGLNSIRYSQNQEKQADLYANRVVYRLYGNNKGAVKFFKMLEQKEKVPEFLYYFSTHPSTKQRLKLIGG